jgi:hypothetical protein
MVARVNPWRARSRPVRLLAVVHKSTRRSVVEFRSTGGRSVVCRSDAGCRLHVDRSRTAIGPTHSNMAVYRGSTPTTCEDRLLCRELLPASGAEATPGRLDRELLPVSTGECLLCREQLPASWAYN